jgi:hypothetical protein
LLIPAKLNYRKAAIAERGLLAPRVKPGFRQCGRFRRQQRIARCCAGSYRHVLILFVHIDRGRGRMCFCKSLAHCRKTQLPKAAWATAARGPIQPSKSPPPRATSWVPSCAVPHCATQSSRQRELNSAVGFPRPRSCPRGFCPECSGGPAQEPSRRG